MPPKVQKSKAAKALAAASASKGKGKKKKWAKMKIREKRDNRVILNKELYDRMIKDVPSKKVITVYTLIEQYKVNGSIARRIMKQLAESGKIKPIITNNALSIYTRAVEKAKKN